ncbi:dimethyl sulfoxide reductase anchor subunit family protein [Uliginosibacterium sp. sgz301328]|uniref:dimethyl sulfoxide reductase anchor subunit family protein n=1 Tax=Uliginosibacterium sp. sgz301328 TaxID=3243764 RepID=UPI00359E7BC2
MGWNEWPLILFTVISQTAVGAFWWCCLALIGADLSSEQRQRLERNMLLLWVMMGAAFALSSFHMGSPFRAMNSMLRFGQANLSNEVVFGGAFAGLGVVYWLLCLRNASSAGVRRFVLLLSLLCSAAFLWNTISFYLMPTVPTWYTPLTPAAFILTAIMGGSALACVLFGLSGISEPWLLRNGPAVLTCIAVVAAVVVTILQATSLAGIQSDIHRATALSPDYGILMAARFALFFVALALWLSQLPRAGALSTAVCTSSIVLIMLGEMIGRGVFYALHMTVGLV